MRAAENWGLSDAFFATAPHYSRVGISRKVLTLKIYLVSYSLPTARKFHFQTPMKFTFKFHKNPVNSLAGC